MLEPLHPKHDLLDGNLTAFRAAYYSTSSSESPFRPEHGMFAVRTYFIPGLASKLGGYPGNR